MILNLFAQFGKLNISFSMCLCWILICWVYIYGLIVMLLMAAWDWKKDGWTFCRDSLYASRCWVNSTLPMETPSGFSIAGWKWRRARGVVSSYSLIFAISLYLSIKVESFDGRLAISGILGGFLFDIFICYEV